MGRPVRQLDSGVARIAGGDYATDIAVTGTDELGRLAGGVNVMRGQISAYIEHVDTSVRRLGEVAQALTTTTTGVEQLQAAVLGAATAIAGTGSAGALLQRDGDKFRVAAAADSDVASLLDIDGARAVLGGTVLHTVLSSGHLTVLPMFYREQVIGALSVTTAAPLPESDERALHVLANNAAIALENARLYDQERETVQKLRALDSLKTDFLFQR